MLWNVTTTLLGGLATTVEIFFLTLLFALPLGLIIAFGTMTKFTPIRWLCNALVWVVRGTPLMLQLIGFFYIPGILGLHIWPGGDPGRVMATVVAFSLNYACYFSVIYRGGIQGVPVGQREAGEVLGRYDGDSQRQALEGLLARLEDGLREANLEEQRLFRVYAALGVTGGLFACILL